MTDHVGHQTAEILAFPNRRNVNPGRPVAGVEALVTSLAARRAPVVDIDAWYHREAIEEEAAARKQ